jgi:flagellar biosynthesis protein
MRAVALRYARGEDGAPLVTARGEGELARRIVEVAAAAGVPVRHDADLVELFAAAEVGEAIPVELYEVVARLLTYLYRLNGEPGGG